MLAVVDDIAHCMGLHCIDMSAKAQLHCLLMCTATLQLKHASLAYTCSGLVTLARTATHANDSNCWVPGKLERALGAANTPLLKPGVARPARPGSGGGRPSSGGRPNSPHSAMAAMGRVSPSSRPASALRRPQSSKHVAMLADSDRAHSSSSAGESQTQDPPASQAQPAQTDDSALHGSDSAAQPPDEAETAIGESIAAAEEAEPAAEVAGAAVPSNGKRKSFTLKAVIDQTMRRQMSSGLGYNDALDTPRHQIGQGFAKWISRAVGNAGLKEKTEIEDLPAYKLRVSCCSLLCLFPSLSLLPLTQLFVHPSLHSFIAHSLLPSFMHSFIHPSIHSFIHSFTHSFSHPFFLSFFLSQPLHVHMPISYVQNVTLVHHGADVLQSLYALSKQY